MLLRSLYDGYADGLDFEDPQEAEASADFELAMICPFSYSHVRLWKGMFDAARVDPKQVRSRDTLRLLPLTNKTTLLERPVQDRLGIAETDGVRMSTSGTTGGPMPVFYSKDFYVYTYSLFRFRVQRTQGAAYFGRSIAISYDARANDRQYMSERAPSTRSKGGIGPLSRLIGWANDRWTKRLFVSTDVGNIMGDIAKYKPDRIFGSPAYLRLVADALNSGVERGIKPKTLLSFGEPLDEPMRRYLEDTFACDVFNAYGSNETGMIAYECEAKSGLHIVQDSVIVEVLNDGKPVGEGEEGEVYVTTLRNKGMPLFRYDVGDRAVMGGHSCRCGRKSPKLRSIEGRRSDFVTSSTGRLVSPLKVGTIMHAIRGLPKYQLVEHRRSEFVLRVFQSDHGTVDELVLALKNELGDVDVRVSLERPDALRAKFRPVISMQTLPLDARWTQPNITR